MHVNMVNKPGIVFRYYKSKFLQNKSTKEAMFSKKKGNNYNFKNLYIVEKDNIQMGLWAMEPKEINDDTICMVILHGTGVNRTQVVEMMQLQKFINANYIVVIPDYRSFGDSEGEFTPETASIDAGSAHDFCRETYGKEAVFLGHSLGGGVALNYLNFSRHRNKIILVSTFTSAIDVWRERFLWKVLSRLCYHAEKDALEFFDFDNMNNIMHADPNQIIIFHGRGDEKISYLHSEALAKKRKCKLVLYEEKNHYTIFQEDDLYRQIDEFVRKDPMPKYKRKEDSYSSD